MKIYLRPQSNTHGVQATKKARNEKSCIWMHRKSITLLTYYHYRYHNCDFVLHFVHFSCKMRTLTHRFDNHIITITNHTNRHNKTEEE